MENNPNTIQKGNNIDKKDYYTAVKMNKLFTSFHWNYIYFNVEVVKKNPNVEWHKLDIEDGNINKV